MKRLLAIGFCVVLQAAAVAPPPNTWRLDFYHTGGKGGEVFSVDKVVVEPLAWPGSPRNNIDSTGFGSYFFELRDTTGKILYSRGFSPIYAEWVTTDGSDEAGQIVF